MISDGLLSSSWHRVLLDIPLILLCLGAIWFYSFAIYGTIDNFRRSTSNVPTIHPPISVLKPVRGLEANAYDILRSVCDQDYPTYQVIFALRDADDPGVPVIQQLIADLPDRDIQLVIDDRSIGMNPKVSNLENALRRATHDILVIADSDIRVGRDYLERVVQPLHDAQVGVVTCLYRSIASGWGAAQEALGIATEFHAGVLVARKLEGMTFALGSTIVIRRSVLEQIGGFAAIANYLADDFQLGHLPAAAGYQVVLSDYVVEHVLASSPVAESLQRQLRWARGTRVCRPWGYIGMIFTYGTVTSLLLLLVMRESAIAWTLWGITWAIRLLMGWVVGVWALQDPTARRFWWLSPVRDLISFAIWLVGFVGDTIEWRGTRLKLTRDGKLINCQLGSEG